MACSLFLFLEFVPRKDGEQNRWVQLGNSELLPIIPTYSSMPTTMIITAVTSYPQVITTITTTSLLTIAFTTLSLYPHANLLLFPRILLRSPRPKRPTTTNDYEDYADEPLAKFASALPSVHNYQQSPTRPTTTNITHEDAFYNYFNGDNNNNNLIK